MKSIGAYYLNNKKCEFIIWAPLLERLKLSLVAPSLREFDLQRDQEGYFHALIDDVGAGTKYFYNIDGRLSPDPVSYYQPEDVFGPSCVVDHTSFAWKDGQWKSIALKSMI